MSERITKVGLVHPEGYNGIAGKEDISTAINRVPPIGLLCLAGYLEAAGVPVKIVDLYGAPREQQHTLLDDLLAWGATIVGFTATTSSISDAYQNGLYIKQQDASVKVVFGGVHVSSLAEKALDPFPEIDAAIIGEGEIPFAAYVKGDDPATIKGVVYRTPTGEVVYSGGADSFVTLDELPLPAYHLLDRFPTAYSLPLLNSPAPRGAPLITSRGCPFTCAYCDRSVYGRTFRSNTPAYIVAHMESLYDRFRVTHFNIYDDLFSLKRQRVEELCGLLEKHPTPFTFNCSIRVGQVDDALLSTMKRGGCYSVSLGIESGDQELLNRHKMGVDLGEVSKTVDMINRAGIRAKGLFIMGLPGETPDTARRTRDYAADLGLSEMNLTKFAPFPGSPSALDIADHGEFIDDWDRMNCVNFVFRPKGFDSFEQMDTIYADVLMGFYGNGKWFFTNFLPTVIRHPHNLVTIIKRFPKLLEARRQFKFSFTPRWSNKG
jgi:radical SAM superfamily enzyme YgiQ (UPF0313 family)